MDVCVLSLEEAGRLEHWGRWPTCKAHIHISKNKARRGVEAGEYRWVGGEETHVKSPVTMVTSARIGMWKPVQAHSEDGRAVIGLRTWGLERQR